MGYSYTVYLRQGEEDIDSWDVSGSYGCIDGKTHPFNVFTYSWDNFKDIRVEVKRLLDLVRDVKDSRQWEQTESILLEIQGYLDAKPGCRYRVDFVNYDYEMDMRERRL